MLTGQTVLIVEEEFLIALDIQRVLESLQGQANRLRPHCRRSAEPVRQMVRISAWLWSNSATATIAAWSWRAACAMPAAAWS